MRGSIFAGLTTSLAITVGAIVAACHNDVPRPAFPAPLTPEVSRDSPKPQPIDTKRKVPHKRVSQAPPADAGVSDALNMPAVPDAAVNVVRDAGQPLQQ